jgi:hypothetical protein
MTEGTEFPEPGDLLEEEGGETFVVLDSLDVMARKFILSSPLQPVWSEFKGGVLHPVTPEEIAIVQTLMEARDRESEIPNPREPA